MANVLIEYAPDAEEEARRLARALTVLDHEVVLGPDTHAFGRNLGDSLAERVAWVKRFDGTVVIWSEASVQGAFVLAVAREALLLGRLVLARVVPLADDRLPPLFAKLKTFSISLPAGPEGRLDGDVKGISDALVGIAALDLITRAGRQTSDAAVLPSADPFPAYTRPRARTPSPQAPRRVGAAEPAAPPELPDWIRHSDWKPEGVGSGGRQREPAKPEGVGAGGTAEEARSVSRALAHETKEGKALEVEAGKLVHKIPNKMWLGEPETVEVRLGREAAAGLASGLVGRGALTEENIPIVETMSVSLYARGGAFEIERQSETTQLVKTDALKGTAFEGTDFGRWTWLVTPKKTGAQQLCVKVSAGLKDSRGVPTTATLPDREFAVSVSVHAGKETMKVLGRVLGVGGGAIAAALIGAMTQDLWWPKVKALLASWGLLG